MNKSPIELLVGIPHSLSDETLQKAKTIDKGFIVTVYRGSLLQKPECCFSWLKSVAEKQKNYEQRTDYSIRI